VVKRKGLRSFDPGFNPEVLILDEPTNGLDPKTQRWLVELLLELNKHGRTIIPQPTILILSMPFTAGLVLSEEHSGL
jgi:cobalt/nickel transport system ATP-binding protein